MGERLVRVRLTAKMAKLMGFAGTREISADFTRKKLEWLLRYLPRKGRTGLALRRRLKAGLQRWERLERLAGAVRG